MKGFHGKTKIFHDPSIELNLQELHDLKIPKKWILWVKSFFLKFYGKECVKKGSE